MNDRGSGLEKSVFPVPGHYLTDRRIVNAETIGNLFQSVAMGDVSFHHPLVAMLPVSREQILGTPYLIIWSLDQVSSF
jgi:hypothetical protein